MSNSLTKNQHANINNNDLIGKIIGAAYISGTIKDITCDMCSKKTSIDYQDYVATESTIGQMPRTVIFSDYTGGQQMRNYCDNNCSNTDMSNCIHAAASYTGNVSKASFPCCITCKKEPINESDAVNNFSYARIQISNRAFISIFYVCGIECKDRIVSTLRSYLGEGKQTCVQCGNGDNKLQKCGRCGESYYCNVKCQRAHWGFHKLSCDAITSRREGKIINKKILPPTSNSR